MTGYLPEQFTPGDDTDCTEFRLRKRSTMALESIAYNLSVLTIYVVQAIDVLEEVLKARGDIRSSK